MATYSPAQFIALVQTLAATVQSLQAQLEWFQRQTFGTKSERLRVLESAQQLALGEVLAPPSSTRYSSRSTSWGELRMPLPASTYPRQAVLARTLSG
jgi:Transposase C of IS166 homeodomain